VLDAESLGGAEMEMSATGGPGFAGTGFRYFKSASDEGRGGLCDHWVLHFIIKKLMIVKL